MRSRRLMVAVYVGVVVVIIIGIFIFLNGKGSRNGDLRPVPKTVIENKASHNNL